VAKTIAELFKRKDTWTQSCMARDDKGEPCSVDDVNVEKWCLVGAMQYLYGDYYFQIPTLRNKMATREVCSIIGGYGFAVMSAWNDKPGRTQEEVQKLAELAGI